MRKGLDLIGRHVAGTAGMLGALSRTSQTLGSIERLAVLGRAPVLANGITRWALTLPAERLGSIGALIERHQAPQEAAEPTIEHPPAPVCVSADPQTRDRTGRRRSRPLLY
jgi:hypothetical protein